MIPLKKDVFWVLLPFVIAFVTVFGGFTYSSEGMYPSGEIFVISSSSGCGGFYTVQPLNEKGEIINDLEVEVQTLSPFLFTVKFVGQGMITSMNIGCGHSFYPIYWKNIPVNWMIRGEAQP